MKKLSIVLALLMSVAMLFSGCSILMNLTDPIPEEFIEGVKLPKDFPDDMEIYDDAVVFEEEEDDEEIIIKYGTEDDIDDLIDFFEDLFDEDEFTLEESEEDDDEYSAKGMGDGFKFEVMVEEAKGKYEERVFKTVVEVKIEFYDMEEDLLNKMQGFWLRCGIGGDIGDNYRMWAVAWQIDSAKLTTYVSSQLDFSNIEMRFTDESTFEIDIAGGTIEVKVRFEGKYMIAQIDGDPSEWYFEKSTYDDMLMYHDTWYDEDAVEGTTWAGEMVYLDDVLTDADLEYFIGYYDWYFTYYLETDGTYSMADFYNRMYFDSYDYIGDDEYIDALYDFTWVISDGILYLYYSDGDIYEYMVDFEYDGVDWYLYLFDSELGYSDYAYVLTTVYFNPEDGETTTSNDGTVGLADYISDEDLEAYVTYIDWYMTLYFEADGTYTDGDFYNRMYLDAYDYTGVDEYDDESYTVTWYIYDSILYLFYPDGSTAEYLIDYEYDGMDQWLYLFDVELGYDDFAYVLRGGY